MEGPRIRRVEMPSSLGHVTLPQLQRLYSQSYARLLGDATLGPEDAHQLVQDAFAQAARIRFTFASESALLAWVQKELAPAAVRPAKSEAPNPSKSGRFRAVGDWDDVLRRASITVDAVAAHDAPPPLAVRSRLPIPSLLRRCLSRYGHTRVGPRFSDATEGG